MNNAIDALIKVIKCECGEDHNIYSYDEPGQFPCRCGKWLEYKTEERDFMAEAKDYREDTEDHFDGINQEDL